MLDRFDYETYRAILRWAGRDRPCVSFPQALEMSSAPYCLVRHDIDFSLTSAMKMAAVEAELGISATYFLLLSAAHYNLLAGNNRRVARALTEMGHEVGLHYDSTTVADLDPDQAVATLSAEAALLGLLAGATVRVVARHNPGFGGPDPLEGSRFLSAYDRRFTDDIAYLSDSCGGWRDSTVATLSADEPPPQLQLLVHPLFWDDSAADRWTQLERVRSAQVTEIEAQTAATRAVWESQAGVAEHDLRTSAHPSSTRSRCARSAPSK